LGNTMKYSVLFASSAIGWSYTKKISGGATSANCALIVKMAENVEMILIRIFSKLTS
jgi:hypothetical protein